MEFNITIQTRKYGQLWAPYFIKMCSIHSSIPTCSDTSKLMLYKYNNATFLLVLLVNTVFENVYALISV